jgi:signal transduction histidine kinase
VLDHTTSTLRAIRTSAVLLDDSGAFEVLVGPDLGVATLDDVPDDLREPVRALGNLDEAVFLATAEDVARRLPEIAPLRPPGGAVAWLPLVSGSTRLGTLFVAFPWQGAFSAAEQELLLALADIFSGVIDRSRLAARERQTRAHLDFLADASRTLAESLDLDVTLRAAAGLAIPLLADGAILDVMNAEGGFSRVVSLPPGSSEEAAVLTANAPQGGPDDVDATGAESRHPTLDAMRQSRTIRYDVSDELIARSVRNDGHRAAAERARGRYAITSPLMLGAAPFGAITLYRTAPGPYSDEEIRIAEEFARRAARAIENSRLHGDHQRALAQATTLVRLNAAVADARSPDEVAGLLLDAIVPLLGAQRGAVFEHDPTTDELLVVRSRGTTVKPGTRVQRPGTLAGEVLDRRETFLRDHSDWDGTFALPAGVTPTEAFLVAPLVLGGEPLGVVSLGFDERPVIAPSLLATYHGLIDAGAQAIVRARLLDGQRRQLERESAVARVNEAVAEARSAEEVARVLLSAVFERFVPRSASLALTDEAADEFVLAGVLGEEGRPIAARPRWSAEMPSPARDVVASARPIVMTLDEYRERYPEIAAISDPAGMGAYVALPLVAAGRPIGALALTVGEGRQLSGQEIEDFQAMADAGGEAIERARLREAERRALGLLEAVVGELPVGVVVVDASTGRVLHANAAVAELLGRTPRTGIHIGSARTLLRTLDGQPIPADATPLARAARDGIASGPLEAVLVREDGSERRVILEGLPVRDEAGRLLAAAATWTDITERRASEAAREAFLGVLSHELRTPITSILAGSGILARRPLGEEEAGLVEDINAESERLHRLVEDLLVLSRVERGADLRRGDPVLVQHVARRVMAHEASRWPDRKFDATVPAGLPAASGDEAYVEQVIRNLLSNAAKYGPPGGTVELVVGGGDDGVEIRVLDRGPGFESQDLARVFELFYRSPSATKIAAGAGIGLYTARVLAEAMGGRIWAANRDGGGAEVGVVIPYSGLESDL